MPRAVDGGRGQTSDPRNRAVRSTVAPVTSGPDWSGRLEVMPRSSAGRSRSGT